MSGRTGSAALTERHVQAIWYDVALRPKRLRTALGECLAVAYPGSWNRESGPDFRRAILELGRERRRVVGDVEVHMQPSDWTSHGHGSDPAYNDVVAHVTWHRGTPPPSLPKGCVSVCIGNAFRGRKGAVLGKIDLSAYPYARRPVSARPCERFFGGDSARWLPVLLEAGWRRMRRKAQRFRQRFMETGDPGQVLYEELFAAFGYSKNTAQFRALAERLPLRDLPKSEEMAREALNCVAAMEIATRMPWHLANVRPNNRPEVRIADAAALFTGGRPRHLGRRLAAAILANVTVPFALARGALHELPRWLPPEGTNTAIRLAAMRLFGRGHDPACYSGNGVLLQGLLQIHEEFCRTIHPDCAECGLVRSFSETQEIGKGA